MEAEVAVARPAESSWEAFAVYPWGPAVRRLDNTLQRRSADSTVRRTLSDFNSVDIILRRR